MIKDFLSPMKNSVLTLLAAILVSAALTMTADMTGAGMAAMVMNVLPLIIGVVGFIIYFI